MRVAIVAVIVALAQALPRPAALQGRAIRAGSGTPVAHARIVAARIGGTASDYRTVVADGDGRFSFDNLPAGTYRLHATHDGYLPGELGRRRAGGSGVPVSLADGQTVSDLEIALTPTGVITGHVLKDGEPLRSAWVRALKSGYVDGERAWSVAGWAESDDRGEYRLFGLAPGAYVVSATARAKPFLDGTSIVTPTVATAANGNARTGRADLTIDSASAAVFERRVYAATYYPGTIDFAAAQPIDVRAGETVAGVDIGVTGTEPFHVRGDITVADPEAAGPASVALQPADISFALPLATAQTGADGRFDLTGVPPGRYYLSAQAAGTVTLSALVSLQIIDQDPPPLSITLRRGSTLTGRLTVDGKAAAASPPAMVMLRGVSARGTCCAAARVGPDGTFTVNNVNPGDYRLRVVQPGRSASIASARFGGEDVLGGAFHVGNDIKGRELEIDMTARTGVLDAIVVDRDHRPLAGVLVIAVPPANRRGQSSAYRSGTTGADGRARIELAAGDYMLFASDSVDAADWQDPAVLQRYETRGTALTIRDGEVRTLTLQVIAP
jgi:hypothetical protein